MKKISFSLTAFLVASLGTLLIVFFWSTTIFNTIADEGYSSIDMPDTDTAFGGVFSSLYTKDSMFYYKYKKAEDSFKRIKHIRDINNNGSGMESFSSGGVGIFSAKKKISSELPLYQYDPDNVAVKSLIDSLNKVYPHPSPKELWEEDKLIDKKMNTQLKYIMDSINRELEKEKFYYFGLSGYKLKDNNTEFYIDNDNYKLTYVKWDTPETTKNKTGRNGHYESKQIKVRYASTRKTILIPITEKAHKILNFIIWTFSFLTGAFILYFLLGLPIRLLINISKGRAFIERNIQILNQISGAAFLIAIITIISPYIFRLLFWKIIPDDFKMESLLNRIIDNLFILIMAIITFVIAKAFNNGHKLQHEQDLTI